MSLSISGIPTSNISDLYVQQRLLDELNASQNDMLNIENELSTGKAVSVASQDPIAAMRIMNLQSQLSVNQQMATNISANQAYMTTTDSAMSSMSNLLSQAQVDRPVRHGHGRHRPAAQLPPPSKSSRTSRP